MKLTMLAITFGLIVIFSEVSGESIEINVYVDKSAQEKWTEKVGTQSYQVQGEIRKFLDGIWAEVNTRMKSLKVNGNPLDVRVKNLKILNINPITDGEISIDVTNFRKWTETQNAGPVDHSMLLTGINLKDKRAGGFAGGAIGTAQTKGMCKSTSQSLVELRNIFDARLAHTIAHELGHSLGADHDGDKSGAGCRTDRNIMTPRLYNRPPYPATEAWRFSSCSQAAVDNYFNEIRSQPFGNCLAQTTAPSAPTKLIGEIYTKEQLCKQAYGPQAKYDAPSYWGSDSCWEISCLTLDTGDVKHHSRADGDGYACNKGVGKCSQGCCNGDCTSKG